MKQCAYCLAIITGPLVVMYGPGYDLNMHQTCYRQAMDKAGVAVWDKR